MQCHEPTETLQEHINVLPQRDLPWKTAGLIYFTVSQGTTKVSCLKQHTLSRSSVGPKSRHGVSGLPAQGVRRLTAWGQLGLWSNLRQEIPLHPPGAVGKNCVTCGCWAAVDCCLLGGCRPGIMLSTQKLPGIPWPVALSIKWQLSPSGPPRVSSVGPKSRHGVSGLPAQGVRRLTAWGQLGLWSNLRQEIPLHPPGAVGKNCVTCGCWAAVDCCLLGGCRPGIMLSTQKLPGIPWPVALSIKWQLSPSGPPRVSLVLQNSYFCLTAQKKEEKTKLYRIMLLFTIGI